MDFFSLQIPQQIAEWRVHQRLGRTSFGCFKMPSTPPSMEWMDAHPLSEEYIKGVASFLQFTKENLGGDDCYCCPCIKCHNYGGGKKSLKVVSEHLICNGIDKSYRSWFQSSGDQSSGTQSTGGQSGRDPSNGAQSGGDQSSGAQSSPSQARPAIESGMRKKVLFNEYGQPIEQGSLQFSTFIGRIARENCPPAFAYWKRVPAHYKETIWNIIISEYEVPEIYKDKILQKAHTAWKNWKALLRKSYDQFHTDAERKINMPKKIKREQWEDFVDFCSTEEDRARRKSGKFARQKLKRHHTTGRNGCARIAQKLKKENPNREVNRTELYLATHTSKNGRVTADNDIEKIKKLVTEDPNLAKKDLDNDPVALVCGRDKKGYVRGMGQGVSRATIRASAPYKKYVHVEKQQHEVLRNEMDTLKEEVATLKELVKRTSRPSHHSSMFITQDQESDSDLPFRNCLLKNFRKKDVACGRVDTDAAPVDEESYSIIVDEIFDTNEDLYDREEKFGDIMVGDSINWPKHSVHFLNF